MWLAGCALVLWTPAVFAGVLLLGIVYARNLEFVHECLHAIALPRPRHNAIVGHLLALPMLVSFERWRREHMRHHRDVQIEGFQYEYARLTTWREYAVHVLMLRHFGDALVRIAEFDRRYHIVTVAVLTDCVVALVTHSWLPIVLWIMPLPIAAVIHTHIELPEHFGLEGIGSADPLQNSRVIPANRFTTWFVNANNYHAIHHWKPSLPIAQLRAAFETMRDVKVSSYRMFYRRFFSGLALVVLLAVGMSMPVRADDYGPHPDLRAIRHDLPILYEQGDGPIDIQDVVVAGNNALVQVQTKGGTRVAILSRRYDRWWREGEILIENRNAIYGSLCALQLDEAFLNEIKVAPALVRLAATHIPLVVPTPTPSPPSDFVKAGCGVESYENYQFFFSRPASVLNNGYLMNVAFANNDAYQKAMLDASLRPPTEAESWMARGGNSYFFFSSDVKSDAAIHIQPGTTIDVWFPFVLNPDKRYSLTIGHADAPIGPIDGTLKNNTLHFVLPAFALTPGAHLMGEIEGDPDGP